MLILYSHIVSYFLHVDQCRTSGPIYGGKKCLFSTIRESRFNDLNALAQRNDVIYLAQFSTASL